MKETNFVTDLKSTKYKPKLLTIVHKKSTQKGCFCIDLGSKIIP